MTKARDIASATPAPSTVSATELGYLDGVSSAIQTQIDSKIGSASAISPTLIDAKGDLIVGSAADTAARLAVGTNDYVLTADSSATNGVKWAAPASGSTFAGCYVYTTTATSVANDTYVKIPFNAEEYDTNGYHDNSTNNTRMTIPSGKGGYYQVNVTTQWGTFAESVCRIAIYVNNAIVSQNSITKTSQFRGFYTKQNILNLAVGDYLEIAVMQGSGSTQDLWGDDSAARGTACSIGLLGA